MALSLEGHNQDVAPITSAHIPLFTMESPGHGELQGSWEGWSLAPGRPARNGGLC